MEQVITPYFVDNDHVVLTLTLSQLDDVRSSLLALNKRRALSREKMSARRNSAGTVTKPCKPALIIGYPLRLSS